MIRLRTDIFKIIKEGSKLLYLDELEKADYSAYCYENDDVVLKFLEKLGCRDNIFNNNSLLRENYNPLLIKQNIILTIEERSYHIPYLLVKHVEHLSTIENYLEKLDSDKLRNIYKNLIRYIFTKDFKYINLLIETEFFFDTSVFAVLNKAITINKFDPIQLEKVVAILNGCEPEKTLVYGAYMDRELESQNKAQQIYINVKNNFKHKNVILIHLESLSNEIYNNQLHHFPIINSLMNKSLRLNNYYSTASSSCMSLTDVLFGNDFENDSFTVFDEMFLTDFYCKNMYEVFYEQGYEVLGIGYKELESEEINSFNLWNFGAQRYQWKKNYSEFTDGISEFIQQSEKPFALHVWNLMTHTGHNDVDVYKGRNHLERMDISYTSLDITVGHIVDCLNKKGILDDTVIIGYGDHGDDKWTRTMNYGFCHTIPPYLNVIKTPAFIYDSRIGSGILNDIVTSVDIKNTALFLCGIENNEEFPYQGINVFEKKNDFAYSRSILTNQNQEAKVNNEWIQRLNLFSDKEYKDKSFCAVNKNYNIQVSNNGLEFFMHKNDPSNYNNLLDFFEMDTDGKIIRFNNQGAWRGHFRNILMVDDQIYDIIYNYYVLRKSLINRIYLKNGLIKGTEKYLMDMSLFNITKPRGFIW